MKKNELYNKVLDEFGLTAQTLMLAEECSELVKACSKMARDKGFWMIKRKAIAEELADVMIMCEQMMQFHSITPEMVKEVKPQKLQRLAERLGVTYETE